jgi:hypothetical protein
MLGLDNRDLKAVVDQRIWLCHDVRGRAQGIVTKTIFQKTPSREHAILMV